MSLTFPGDFDGPISHLESCVGDALLCCPVLDVPCALDDGLEDSDLLCPEDHDGFPLGALAVSAVFCSSAMDSSLWRCTVSPLCCVPFGAVETCLLSPLDDLDDVSSLPALSSLRELVLPLFGSGLLTCLSGGLSSLLSGAWLSLLAMAVLSSLVSVGCGLLGGLTSLPSDTGFVLLDVVV